MRIIEQCGRGSFDSSVLRIFVSGSAILASNGDHCWCLGEYETEERTQEVFDELHAAYETLPFSGNDIYRMPKE